MIDDGNGCIAGGLHRRVHADTDSTDQGGARSPLWRQILADVLNTEVVTVTATEGAAFGAALLGGVGVSVHPSVEAACDAAIAVVDHTPPDPGHAASYERTYEVYTQLYPALRSSMRTLGTIG